MKKLWNGLRKGIVWVLSVIALLIVAVVLITALVAGGLVIIGFAAPILMVGLILLIIDAVRSTKTERTTEMAVSRKPYNPDI